MQHVFIVGSKGIPGNYGGYETFVDKLTEYHQNYKYIRYHVACAVDRPEDLQEYEYHNAHCFSILRKKIGPAQAIFYDLDALDYCVNYIKSKHINKPVIYVLACRIGPFFKKYVQKLHQLGGVIYVNPDGHEWLRNKWSTPVKKYWKFSERLMTKHCDLLICDSKNIEQYIQQTYARYHPNTIYIAYGAEARKSTLSDDDKELQKWYRENGLTSYSYYLVVGRFVPENNYETIIREFMKSNTKRDLAIITNVNNRFLEELESNLHFRKDHRIKFVGTLYDTELLMKIRENAYAYLHGHEVGGTNPSLLEALSSTDLNLLLDVKFNREVAENGALYWTKECGHLAGLINSVDRMYDKDRELYGVAAQERIRSAYSWKFIGDKYKQLWERMI